MIYLDSEVWSALQLCQTRTIERDVHVMCMMERNIESTATFFVILKTYCLSWTQTELQSLNPWNGHSGLFGWL